jgi:hypothetical protein
VRFQPGSSVSAALQTCSNCGQPLPKGRRRYCDGCSHLASALWKRRNRLECAGAPYWLDSYLKRLPDTTTALAAYREDCRVRVARSRARRRSVSLYRQLAL